MIGTPHGRTRQFGTFFSSTLIIAGQPTAGHLLVPNLRRHRRSASVPNGHRRIREDVMESYHGFQKTSSFENRHCIFWRSSRIVTLLPGIRNTNELQPANYGYCSRGYSNTDSALGYVRR